MDNTQLLKQIADAMAQLAGTQTKEIAHHGTFTEIHGMGSLFGSVPVERDVISARVTARGLMNYLPAIPTTYDQPHFASITGYTAVDGAEGTSPCANFPSSYMKGCNLTAQFGQILRDTKTIDIAQTIHRANRGDFTDLILHGDLMGDAGVFKPGGLTQEGILNVVTKNEMVMVASNAAQVGCGWTWQGNPALASCAAGTCGQIPFPGLDWQIATGQRDAEFGQLCPALDSDVKDFAWEDIENVGGRDIVEYLEMLEYYLVIGNASRMGLLPAKWVVVMRPELWHVLTDIWPCKYNTNKCAQSIAGLNVGVILTPTQGVGERDAMRNGMYIDINGRRYPVVVDDCIFEFNVTNNSHCLPGQYASSIYFVPVEISGGFPVCYYEFLDYRQIGVETALLHDKQMFWSDDGRFLWGYEDVGAYCYKLKLRTNPRIVLRTPQLAGRIDHVKYVPLQHLRSPDPSSVYHMDGGVSLRPDPKVYTPWPSFR